MVVGRNGTPARVVKCGFRIFTVALCGQADEISVSTGIIFPREQNHNGPCT